MFCRESVLIYPQYVNQFWSWWTKTDKMIEVSIVQYQVIGNIPTLCSFPNTVLSPRAVQFHRPCLNWNWHSLIPICAPSPITMIASGLLRQIVLCLGARPGILLQITLAPSATTEEKPLLWETEEEVTLAPSVIWSEEINQSSVHTECYLLVATQILSIFNVQLDYKRNNSASLIEYSFLF